VAVACLGIAKRTLKRKSLSTMQWTRDSGKADFLLNLLLIVNESSVRFRIDAGNGNRTNLKQLAPANFPFSIPSIDRNLDQLYGPEQPISHPLLKIIHCFLKIICAKSRTLKSRSELVCTQRHVPSPTALLGVRNFDVLQGTELLKNKSKANTIDHKTSILRFDI